MRILNSLKHTKQRAAILKILEDAQEPISAEELFFRLSRQPPVPALSTVYRNLERFTQEGMVERSDLGDGIVRYCRADGRHGHYLICTGCAERIKIDGCPLSPIEQGLKRDTGYEIEGHTLTIYGKCPRCTAKDSKGKR